MVRLALVAALVLAPAATGIHHEVAEPIPDGTTATSHLGSTWDAPGRRVAILGRSAVSGTVTATTVVTPAATESCDLYTTTYDISWQAEPGRTLTAVVTHSDDFAASWRFLDQDTWTMSPEGQLADARSPIDQTWYLKGTRRSDTSVCPRDTRTINHVEIYVDGAPRHAVVRSIVDPPSKNHLAAVWTWPDAITVIEPARVTVTSTLFLDVQQGEVCQARITELDLSFDAIGSARIIAVGLEQDGVMQYQNGNAAAFARGVGGQEWFLDGEPSEACPEDWIPQRRMEIYTDVGRSG